MVGHGLSFQIYSSPTLFFPSMEFCYEGQISVYSVSGLGEKDTLKSCVALCIETEMKGNWLLKGINLESNKHTGNNDSS